MTQDRPVQILLQVQPLTLNRRDALAFSGLAEKLFNELEKSGSLRGRRYGKNGQIIYRRAEIELVVARLFGASDEFDVSFDGPIEFL